MLRATPEHLNKAVPNFDGLARSRTLRARRVRLAVNRRRKVSPDRRPVYTWVRLAQRVPVRIRITHVPAGVPLVSGMTATVTIRDSGAQQSGGWLRQRFASLADQLGDIAHAPHSSPSCVPRISNENGVTVTLPTPKPVAALDPAEIDPGLAPNMNASPRGQ